jgi:hypothetical protein
MNEVSLRNHKKKEIIEISVTFFPCQMIKICLFLMHVGISYVYSVL